MHLSLGIDFGTSGARAIAITPEYHLEAEVISAFTDLDPVERASTWKSTLFELIRALPITVRSLPQHHTPSPPEEITSTLQVTTCSMLKFWREPHQSSKLIATVSHSPHQYKSRFGT